MSGAREEILGRIRQALGESPAPDEPAPGRMAPRPTPDPAQHEELVQRFVAMTADYRAVVERCGPGEISAHVDAALRAHHAGRVVIPAGLEREWMTRSGADLVHDGAEVAVSELDRCDAVVTAAAVAIAETGTIVLDHTPDQGRRAVTLVPDVHVCVVRESQVVADVPGAIRLLRPAIAAHRALTWISGPSATSDIELNRIEGVHGPRHLHVIVVAG